MQMPYQFKKFGTCPMVVLVVDDDAMILRATEAILRRGGYSPTPASGPIEALRKSRDFKGEIDLLLTDVTMPGMNGPSLARRIMAERPLIRVLLISAGANVSSRLPLLKKPFSMAQLLAQVAQVIDAPPPLPADVFAEFTAEGKEAPPDLN